LSTEGHTSSPSKKQQAGAEYYAGFLIEKSLSIDNVFAIVPTTTRYDGHKLVTLENSRRMATPLFAVLVLIEAADVVFAVDSVPAMLAVSRVPFIVFAANAFAILGLRYLCFACRDCRRDHHRDPRLDSG
jgi:predicted tellurium resistance membrane protein TerC